MQIVCFDANDDIVPLRIVTGECATAGIFAETYIGDGAMVISAANAIDDNNDAAPAATRDLTLRIGFALWCSEAGNGASHPELTAGRWHRILKRRLTLILKVDNL
jgi:hypothetical protein